MVNYVKKDLPKGFGYVYEFIPGLRESILYSTTQNFMGRIVDGYGDATSSNSVSRHAVLTFECIEALKKVQRAASELGYDILLYDGYRPKRAVDDFVYWAGEDNEQDSQQYYYPNYSKSELLIKDYINDTSAHCSGSAVDLTLIRKDQKVFEKVEWSYRSHNGNNFPYRFDGSLDMFTGFDLFDIASHHDSALIPSYALEHRNLLRRLMTENGFESIKAEWWHYVLENEPYKGEMFDFLF